MKQKAMEPSMLEVGKRYQISQRETAIYMGQKSPFPLPEFMNNLSFCFQKKPGEFSFLSEEEVRANVSVYRLKVRRKW